MEQEPWKQSKIEKYTKEAADGGGGGRKEKRPTALQRNK